VSRGWNPFALHEEHVLPVRDAKNRDNGLSALVAAMARPDFYPERPSTVELRQTHISYVFLAGEHVYKIKKAVRFPFMDCTKLETRRHFCFEEVRLNRRLAPDIYAGVVPIMRTRTGFVLGDLADGKSHDSDKRRRDADEHIEAYEYAVKMRRLPDGRMLDRLVAQGSAEPKEIHLIAERLARFHRDAAAAQGWNCGSAAAVAKMISTNLEECGRFEGHTTNPAQLNTLREYNRKFLEQHWALLNSRSRDGYVREGHGDLRCEHVCISPAGDLVIVDCVEFSERLRYADVACDIAFLAMDLDRLGAQALSEELINSYAHLTNDSQFAGLVEFYKCYRTVVRAKVESLRSIEIEVPAAERERARGLAHQYFALALRYAGGKGAHAAVIVVCGAAGTGKSTLARAFGERLGFEVISSDAVRKQLAGVSPTARMRASYGAGIYTEEFTERTYEALIAEARKRLAEGRAIVLDATFRHPAERRPVVEMATQIGAPFLFVECRADDAEVLHRLRKRERQHGEVSDATADIYVRQRAYFVQLDEIPERCRLIIDTSRHPREVADQIADVVTRLFEEPQHSEASAAC
jgi:aminoglycoside phosphotransferase family enzyme/predicted kinase